MFFSFTLLIRSCQADALLMPVCNQVAARFGLSKGSFWTFFGGLPLKKGILGAGLPGCRGNALARASAAVWRFVDDGS